ncbi:MAG TPA: hypothetical protein VK217_12615, partial [Acidimicrobiales bacterium]|nr:hypothetical protein [Acidimicrobiales bacterium]
LVVEPLSDRTERAALGLQLVHSNDYGLFALVGDKLTSAGRVAEAGDAADVATLRRPGRRPAIMRPRITARSKAAIEPRMLRIRSRSSSGPSTSGSEVDSTRAPTLSSRSVMVSCTRS